ncbi:hypothetical protein LPJ73_001525 [Coemansia sp. RSA 2703]|nr:hypothetical protein LPJ73_001525 [Coemansia sp. RSA 2703]KAJ2372824.1 hypothetical protein IW150_003925 [Coemansia sp. RSA 2607]KAJ2395188.1 hypothetical protein GGI05_001703 [Coemansia sp. RSA 2603]
MLLYTDIITGDELFSDAFPMKEIPGAFEVDCKMITIGDDDIDIGANPSAEGGDDEAVESSAQTVNNVVHSFRLVETSFDKKSYVTYIKGYMKSLEKKFNETIDGLKPEEAKNDEEKAKIEEKIDETKKQLDAFKKNAAELAKKIVGNFKDYEFYTGESMNPDGMVALLNYREDGVTPYFTFFADGVKKEKL